MSTSTIPFLFLCFQGEKEKKENKVGTNISIYCTTIVYVCLLLILFVCDFSDVHVHVMLNWIHNMPMS